MKKRVVLIVLGIFLLVSSLSCASIPKEDETETANTQTLEERITALEQTIAQMNLESNEVSMAQVKQLEDNLQFQITELKRRINELEDNVVY